MLKDTYRDILLLYATRVAGIHAPRTGQPIATVSDDDICPLSTHPTLLCPCRVLCDRLKESLISTLRLNLDLRSAVPCLLAFRITTSRLR